MKEWMKEIWKEEAPEFKRFFIVMGTFIAVAASLELLGVLP